MRTKKNSKNSTNLNQLAATFLSTKAVLKDAKIDAKSAHQLLAEFIEPQVFVETDHYQIFHNNYPRQILDQEKLQKEKPELFKKYLRNSDCWVLSVKDKLSTEEEG